MFFDDMFFIAVVIGMNIGVAIGWFACKHFGGDMAKVMKWIEDNRKENDMRKLISIMIWVTLACGVMAINKDGFTLSVIYDGKPIKEMVEDGKLRVAILFNSEYKLRLKNKFNRRCSVSITIDGCAVSMLGDIIVNANGEIDLERFIDASLTEGNKFKFVSLSDPAVDDPTKAENGLIEATFTMEKEKEPASRWEWLPIGVTNLLLPSPFTNGIFYCASTLCSASTEAGATVQGSESDQSFRKVEFDGEDESITLKLWLRGIKTVDEAKKQYSNYLWTTSRLDVAIADLQVNSNATNATVVTVLDVITDDEIRKLCKNGRVCEVMGHSWGESYHSNDGFTTDWNTWIRACHICGKQESKSMNDWK